MKGRFRTWLRLGLAASSLTAVLACNTPSVPLPPPNLAVLQFQPTATAGFVVLHGTPGMNHAGDIFAVFNRAKGKGASATVAADGSFTTDPLEGGDGDLIQVSYTKPTGETSQDACAQLMVSLALLPISCP